MFPWGTPQRAFKVLSCFMAATSIPFMQVPRPSDSAAIEAKLAAIEQSTLSSIG